MRIFIKKYLLPTLPWVILAFLLFFTYAIFFVLPYFDYHIESDNIVVVLYVEENETNLKLGDKVIEINGNNINSINNDLLNYKFKNITIGKPYEIIIERGGEIIILEQFSKKPGREELIARLTSQWWFAYAFWLAGLITYLNIRPRNSIWKILVAFFFLISIWMIVSSGPSSTYLFGGAIFLRIGILLTVPVIIHLHWNYPVPMDGKTKTPVWIQVIYYLSIGTAFLQIFQLIPSNLYVLSFLLSLLISIFLIIVRLLKFKKQRKAYAVISIFTLIAILPGIIVSLMSVFSILLPYPLSGLVALSFPLIPMAYFYSINRQKLGKLEFRVNKLISFYLYAVILGTILLILLPLLAQIYSISDGGTLLAISSSLIFSLISIIYFIPFQRLIENRVLGIPLNIDELKRNFTSQLNTTLDHDQFKSLIEEKVSASMLIRQSALYEIENKQLTILYAQNVENSLDLNFEDLHFLMDLYSKFIQTNENSLLPKSISWAKVILPISFENRMIGIWVFGKRDPDDFYSSYDIEILQTLADQLAVSVINHQQSQNLRELYQQNIDRHEAERARLARELHDDTLNNLALIKQQSSNPIIIKETESVISDLRKIIQGLRPEMLTYGGLATALEDLADLLNERQNNIQIETNIISEPTETDEKVELHIFRIVQQACENSLQHSKAKNLLITGNIKPDYIDLEIADDGIGFSGSTLDFSKLLSEQHYGLAGMYERASLINAKVRIESAFGLGTKTYINWEI